MGLFGSKKETIVGTTVSRVIQDELLPSAIKTGVLRSMFSGEEESEAIFEEVISSIGLKADRMYNFGKDKYIYGLPKKTSVTTDTLEDKVQTALESHHGNSVSLVYAKFGPLNNLHAGWTQLFNDYGYNPTTNQIGTLTAVKGTPVFLTDMVVVVKEATAAEWASGELSLWDNPRERWVTEYNAAVLVQQRDIRGASKVEIDSSIASDYVRVEYTWIAGGVRQHESMVIPLTGFDEAADYFQAKYDLNGTQHILTYLDNSGGIPELDDVFTSGFDDTGSFFPIGYLRWQKQQIDTDINSRAYKDSVKLTKYLGINYQDMVASIEESPDINDVEQAMLLMAVPANTDKQIEQRYLFDFFKQLHAYTGGTGDGLPVKSVDTFTLLNQRKPSSSLIIQDAKFKMALSYNTLHKKKQVGVIGAVGTYASGRGSYFVSERVSSVNAETGEKTEQTLVHMLPTHYYRKQLTTNVYEEYEIANLELTYYITEKYRTTSDESDKILLIPIDRSITEHYSVLDREELYSRSLHYIFNSMLIVKVKWYQQEWFGDVMLVVAIALTIVSMGSDSGFFINLAAAVSAGLAATLNYLIIVILNYMVIKAAMKLIVKLVGPELAFIFAVAMVAYAGYEGFQAGGLQNSPMAKDMLFLANGLSSGAKDVMTDSLLGLESEKKAFGLEMEEKNDLLEEANKLLGSQQSMTPFVVFGESPDDFFKRTAHSGNIGTLSFDYIHSYVDMNLALPKMAQTIGGFIS